MDKLKIKEFFDYVYSQRLKNISLSNIFKNYARANNLACNSVRNIYYTELKLMGNNEYAKSINVNSNDFKIQKFVNFSNEEIKNLIDFIDKNKQKGISVRKSCLSLSGGDVSKMIRLQNKYRSEIKKNMNKKILYPNNVIMMNNIKDNLITNKDINALFLGLVRIIKINAVKDIDLSLKNECEFTVKALRNSIAELKDTKEKLNDEKEKNKVLLKKLELLSQSEQNLNKLDVLKKYFNDLKLPQDSNKNLNS
jgi:hypothetical protein